VKALESRSLLLETALASVEEANRRWEEARHVAESLRIENNQLRAALAAFQQAGAAVAQMQQQAAQAQARNQAEVIAAEQNETKEAETEEAEDEKEDSDS